MGKTVNWIIHETDVKNIVIFLLLHSIKYSKQCRDKLGNKWTKLGFHLYLQEGLWGMTKKYSNSIKLIFM